MKKKTVFVGGTFDRLHKGHKYLLEQALSVGEHIVIGLTTDIFLAKFKRSQKPISVYEARKRAIDEWLEVTVGTPTVEIHPIDDPYEPAASADYQALIVTEDNLSRGKEINRRRIDRGLQVVELIEIEMLPADDGKYISSTRIREGQIDSEGHLEMPESLRVTLQKPLGKVLVGREITESLGKNKHKVIITVGDKTTKVILDAGINPKLAIIDRRVQRQPFAELEDFIVKQNGQVRFAKSGPGFISQAAIRVLNTWKKHPQSIRVLVITGEEDLLTLPVIARAPIGSIVYYGQPAWSGSKTPEGIVEVVISRAVKQLAIKHLKKFTH